MMGVPQRCSLHVRSHNEPALKLYISLLGFSVDKVETKYYADREDAFSVRSRPLPCLVALLLGLLAPMPCSAVRCYPLVLLSPPSQPLPEGPPDLRRCCAP